MAYDSGAAMPAGGVRPRGGAGFLFWLLSVVVFVLLLWWLRAIFAEPVGSGTGVTLGDLGESPAAYAGRSVTVSGEVGEAIGSKAFTFEGGEVLVLGAQGVPSNFGFADGATLEGRAVRVTGRVRMFDLAQAESELGYDLDENVYGSWEGRPAIIARAAEPVAE